MAQKQRPVAGVILIVVGLALLVVQRTEGLGPNILLAVVGAAFLTAYFLQRNYGYLIPGCILTGLGLGSWYGDSFFSFESTLFGLGCGFVGIFLVGLLYERRRDWWPLIPGGILILISMPDTERLFRALFRNWPVALILVGVVLLLSSLRRSRPRPGAGA